MITIITVGTVGQWDRTENSALIEWLGVLIQAAVTLSVTVEAEHHRSDKR